jgi:hypothetical protein
MTVLDLLKWTRDNWSTVLFWIGVALLIVSIVYGFIWPFFAGVWIGLPKMIEHIASGTDSRAARDAVAFKDMQKRIDVIEEKEKEQWAAELARNRRATARAGDIIEKETPEQLRDRVLSMRGTDDE